MNVANYCLLIILHSSSKAFGIGKSSNLELLKVNTSANDIHLNASRSDESEQNFTSGIPVQLETTPSNRQLQEIDQQNSLQPKLPAGIYFRISQKVNLLCYTV